MTLIMVILEASLTYISFNSIKACFVALEQRGSTRNDTFSWFWPRIPKIKKKFENQNSFVF